jgi:hypothetical protein
VSYEFNANKRNGNNRATAVRCQALIHSGDHRRTIALKMPNSRKKAREFGIA